ncbi:ArsR family transcriptional regulator [Xanthobacter sp. VNH20]|uniref:ArsR/SmtB family transcription factor n=1 Tax=Xanthobacter sp. VNH20 TaxID=3156616 RepID=UPI0032B4215F
MPDAEGHPAPEEMELGKIFAALADPMRRKVVLTLLQEESETPRACGTFGMPVAKATRTHHFRVLREAGLIFQVDRGNGRLSNLRRAELNQRFPGLLDLLMHEGAREAGKAAGAEAEEPKAMQPEPAHLSQGARPAKRAAARA